MPLIDDNGDVHLAADARGDGIGSIILSTGGVERHRVKPDGTGTGVFGGTIPTASDGSVTTAATKIVSKNLPMLEIDSLGLSRVLGRFRSLSAGDLALTRSGNDYSLCYGWGDGRYWQSWLKYDTSEPGGYALNQLRDQAEVVPMLSKDDQDASIVYGGSGWTPANTQALSYGGTYTYSASAGATATWTTIAAVTRVGARVVHAVNGGLFQVKIDGDKTAANLLPTAQNVIDSGAYPNTILVANGGTLNPSDRVLDCFNGTATYDNLVAIADVLPAQVHTVVFTVVGATHNNGGTGTRGYLSGLSYALASTTISTASTALFSVANLNSTLGSAWEYALRVLPSGGTTPTFLGNIHGYDVQDSLTFTVDGVAVTPADGSVATPDNTIEITRISHLLHPDTGTSVVANIVTVYRLDVNGLRVDVKITWAKAADVTAAYVMMPLNGSTLGYDVNFTKADILTYGSGPITLPGTSDGFYGNVKSSSAWMWGGNYGALMWMPNVTDWTNNWTKSGSFLAVEDRNGGTSKIYIGRVWNGSGNTESVISGNVWNASTQYLIGRFPGGADATLGTGVTATVPAPTPDLFMGLNTYREPYPRHLCTVAPAALTSGVMYLVGMKLYAGDVINSLSFLSGGTALTMGTNNDGHLWFALYDPTVTLMAQTADQGGAATWAANTVKTLALTAKQTIKTAGVYYAGVMVNDGTLGSPVMPSLRGIAMLSNAVSGKTGWPSGVVQLSGQNGSALVATAPTGPLTITDNPSAYYCMTS